MADTSHDTVEKAKFPPVITATFILFIIAIGLGAVLSSPPQDLRAYTPEQQFIVTATDMPGPLRLNGQVWIPVVPSDGKPVDPSRVELSGASAGGFAIGRPAGDPEAAKSVMFLRDKAGRWQRYTTLAAFEGSEAEAASPDPEGIVPLPAAFRFRGYTWRPGGQAVFKNSVTPLMMMGKVLGRAIYANEPGPEANRNSVYVEVRPGGDTVEPYLPEEALYSTSSQSGRESPGLGGQPNPYPTTGSPSLPFQPVQDPRNPDAVLQTGPSGAVTPAQAPATPPAPPNKPNTAP